MIKTELLPTVNSLKAEAATIFDRARDESREAAILTIATALLHAYSRGAETGINALRPADCRAEPVEGPDPRD